MLFITNRVIKESIKSDVGRRITFDIDNNNAGQSVFFCERESANTYKELGSQDFFAKMRDSEAEQILLYIHGYSNLPEEHVFPRSEMLQTLFDGEQEDLIQVVPLIWPCDNDITVLEDYYDDQKAADASALAFARMLEKFKIWQANQQRNVSNIDECCRKRINVLAHSMGNRVFREALRHWAKYEGEHKIPQLFRNSFLAAADIVNESLEKGKAGYLISQASRNVTVYYAGDDLALRSSKVINLRNGIASRRLGHTGPEDPSKVSQNVYSVDCDEVNSKYDFPSGHSYFLDNGEDIQEGQAPVPGEVFKHMLNSINTGRVKDNPPRSKHIIL
jgi:esterase/lipase superfamily enzyme